MVNTVGHPSHPPARDIGTLLTSDSRDQSRGYHQTIHKLPKFPSNCLAVSKPNVHGS